VQAPHAPASSRHSKVEPLSDETKKVAELELLVPDGPEVIVVSGGSRSGRPGTCALADGVNVAAPAKPTSTAADASRATTGRRDAVAQDRASTMSSLSGGRTGRR
jgi:hypothetical protein